MDDLDNLVHKVSMKDEGVIKDWTFIQDGYFLSDLELDTEKDGYVFIGWVDETGKTVDDSTQCTRDMVLTPRYVREEDATTVTEVLLRDKEFYVLFDDEHNMFIVQHTTNQKRWAL